MAGTIANWVGEMAPYVKSLDSNHLLTAGEEGFYSTSRYGRQAWQVTPRAGVAATAVLPSMRCCLLR